MRLLGTLEATGCWLFPAEHVPGAVMSRRAVCRPEHNIFEQTRIGVLRPGVSWQEYDLVTAERGLSSWVLA